jgi:hypothetical protein
VNSFFEFSKLDSNIEQQIGLDEQEDFNRERVLVGE